MRRRKLQLGIITAAARPTLVSNCVSIHDAKAQVWLMTSRETLEDGTLIIVSFIDFVTDVGIYRE